MKKLLYIILNALLLANSFSINATETLSETESSKIYIDPQDIVLGEHSIEVLINGNFVSIPQLNVDENGIYMTIRVQGPWYWECDRCHYLNDYDTWICAKCKKKREVKY